MYALRESVVQRKTWSSGNFWAARRACAGFRNIPNTAEPLPASEASAAPCSSNSRRIRPRRGCRRKTAASKSFERPAPCGLQHRAQKLHSLDTAACFVNRVPRFRSPGRSSRDTLRACSPLCRAATPPAPCGAANPAADKSRRRGPPSARPPNRKNGTSAPSAAAISSSRGSGMLLPVRRNNPTIAAAASLEPPPSPRPTECVFAARRVSLRSTRPALLASSCEFTLHRVERAPHQIFPARRSPPAQRRPQRAVRCPGSLVRRSHQRVVQRQRLENGAQFVIAVRAAPQNVQAQIDLGKCGHANREHCTAALLRLGRRGFLLRDLALHVAEIFCSSSATLSASKSAGAMRCHSASDFSHSAAASSCFRPWLKCRPDGPAWWDRGIAVTALRTQLPPRPAYSACSRPSRCCRDKRDWWDPGPARAVPEPPLRPDAFRGPPACSRNN